MIRCAAIHGRSLTTRRGRIRPLLRTLDPLEYCTDETSSSNGGTRRRSQLLTVQLPRGFNSNHQRCLHSTRMFSTIEPSSPTIEPSSLTITSTTAPLSSEELLNDKNVNHATRFVLNAKQNPLGSMSTSSWNDTATVIAGWLPLEDGKTGTDALIGSRLTGYSLDSVDRLVQRLMFEQATARPNSELRNERDLILAHWHTMLVHGWIMWSQRQTEPAMIAAAAERAESALGRIVDWYNSGGCWPISSKDDITQDALPVDPFVLLVKEWLRTRNPVGTMRAIDLLMSWTEGEGAIGLLENYKDDVSFCLNTAIERSTNLVFRDIENDELKTSTTALAHRLDLLRDAGWETLESSSVLVGKPQAMNASDATKPSDTIDQDDEVPNPLQGPEGEEFWGHMVELIASADKTDYDTIVGSAIPRIMKSKDVPVEFARNAGAALLDYFIKVKDPRYATNWLQRLEQIRKSSNDPTRSQAATTQISQHLAVLNLWIQEAQHFDESVWRADEILQHCEKLQQDSPVKYQDTAVITSSMYVKLLRMWATHTEDIKMAANKVHEMLGKIMQVSATTGQLDGFELIDVLCVLKPMAAGKSSDKLTENEISALVNFVKKRRDDTPKEVLKDTLVAIAELLGNREMMAEMESLYFELANADESSEVPTILLKRLLLSLPADMPSKSRIEYVEKLGGFDDKLSAIWDLQCYETAIAAFLRNENGDDESVDKGEEMLGIVLRRTMDGELSSFKPEDLGGLVESAVTQSHRPRNILAGDKLKQDNIARAYISNDILQVAEEKLLSMDPESPIRKRFPTSPIPVSCFRRVMFSLLHTKQFEKAEEVFVRGYDYFRVAGYESLLPDRSTLIGMAELKYSQKHHGIAKELESLVHEWTLHKSTHSSNSSDDLTAVYDITVGAYKREKDDAGALAFIERQLPTLLAGPATDKAASILVGNAIRLASGLPPEQAYDLIVNKYHRMYIADENRTIQLNSSVWGQILYACVHAPAGEKDSAMKLGLVSLTAIRQHKDTKPETYKVIASIVQNAYPENGNAVREQVGQAIFESCYKDNCLTRDMKNMFYGTLGIKKGSPAAQPAIVGTLIEE